MSQFDAKLIYNKGEDNSVANALPCLPAETDCSTAKDFAKHPYDFCEDNDTMCTIAHVVMPSI